MKWLAFGIANAVASLAAAFTTSSTARDVAVVIAVASAFALVMLGARSDQRAGRADRRAEEAHERLLELTHAVEQAAMTANSAHQVASRSVLERQWEEQYETFVKPTDDAVKQLAARVRVFFTGRASSG